MLFFAELVADLREAILQIARHFDAIDPKKVRTLLYKSEIFYFINRFKLSRTKHVMSTEIKIYSLNKLHDCMVFIYTCVIHLVRF